MVLTFNSCYIPNEKIETNIVSERLKNNKNLRYCYHSSNFFRIQSFKLSHYLYHKYWILLLFTNPRKNCFSFCARTVFPTTSHDLLMGYKLIQGIETLISTERKYERYQSMSHIVKVSNVFQKNLLWYKYMHTHTQLIFLTKVVMFYSVTLNTEPLLLLDMLG